MNTQNRMVEFEYEQKIALIKAYSAAKSRQDINAALALCTDGFSLYAEAFGTSAHGQQYVRAQLEIFFNIFPDFNAEIKGFGINEYGAVCWATCQMTMAGRLGKLSKSRIQTAQIPFMSIFTFSQQKLASERFFFSFEV